MAQQTNNKLCVYCVKTDTFKDKNIKKQYRVYYIGII